jgi:hypothetical protein
VVKFTRKTSGTTIFLSPPQPASDRANITARAFPIKANYDIVNSTEPTGPKSASR